jgi:hypothetical protein
MAYSVALEKIMEFAPNFGESYLLIGKNVNEARRVLVPSPGTPGEG